MEELYTEGVATHGGPESCVGVREGGGEALTGARAGQAIEPRNESFGVPTLSKGWKATLLSALREVRSEPQPPPLAPRLQAGGVGAKHLPG